LLANTVIVQQGTTVYLTYHDADLDATPTNPTGDGTAGGWHTTLTIDTNWMSTKIGANGSWSYPQPITSAIGTTPVTDENLVGHWKMNDDKTNTVVVDYSGEYNHGTAQQNTEDINDTGKINGALSFNGSTDRIVVADDPSFDFTTTFSVFAWIKPTAVATAQGIITKYYSVGDLREWALILNGAVGTDAKISVVLGNTGGTGETIETSDNLVVSNDSWYHVGFTYAAGVVTIFVNGVAVASTNSGTHVTSLNNEAIDIEIGRYNTNTYFAGLIDDVRVYNKVLSTIERAAIYNAGDGTESPGLWTGSLETITNTGSIAQSDITDYDDRTEIVINIASTTELDGVSELGIYTNGGDSDEELVIVSLFPDIYKGTTEELKIKITINKV